MDESIISSLLQTLEGNPGNVILRGHLAELLFRAGRYQETLEQCQLILASKPDDWGALGYAAAAAEALGDKAKAEAFQRVQDALGSRRAPPQAGGTAGFGGRAGLDEEPDDSAEEPEKLELGGAAQPAWSEESNRITLADVAGMDEVKQRLNRAFLGPLKNPEMMRLYGKSVRGGLMLYGPPGCGKTYIARAVAGELGARFFSVGLSEVLDMYIGQSERNLARLFEAARRSSPCVLFFDEVDALGRKRSLRRDHAGRDVVNQLLSELDGIQCGNQGVFVLAATNHPWDVDSALRRPGRFDRMLLVLPPDAAARAVLVESTMRSRPVEKLDYRWIAGETNHYSGADLVHLCEAATEMALEESLSTGKVRPVTLADFKRAIKDIKPSTRPWFETARNYALFANDGGSYDDLLVYLKQNGFA
ncbi:MAG: ATP-binding protein [Acidobacteria bacterium]|nr:ATP-binding protein [Acidobacteriota bacterium]